MLFDSITTRRVTKLSLNVVRGALYGPVSTNSVPTKSNRGPVRYEFWEVHYTLRLDLVRYSINFQSIQFGVVRRRQTFERGNFFQRRYRGCETDYVC